MNIHECLAVIGFGLGIAKVVIIQTRKLCRNCNDTIFNGFRGLNMNFNRVASDSALIYITGITLHQSQVNSAYNR